MTWTDGLEHILREQEPLAARNWLRLGGAAQFLAEPTNQDELQILVRRCREDEIPVRLLGGGSNVLIPDEGLPGVVVSLTAADFAKVEVQGQRIRAGGAEQPFCSRARMCGRWPPLLSVVDGCALVTSFPRRDPSGETFRVDEISQVKFRKNVRFFFQFSTKYHFTVCK